MSTKSVVLLVDHRERDLRGCALIAHHLQKMGIEPHLEPINAWQAVLGAHKPDLIVFNHTNRKHLADYTQVLSRMGVLTAVLLNEGLLYSEQVRTYNSQRLPNLHLDYYFCWNDLHRQCLLASGYEGKTEIITVGVPRFDFYFDPWKRVFNLPPRSASQRQRILLCTNFGYAEWRSRPKQEVDRFFSQWSHMPAYAEYWKAIEISYRSRLRFFEFLHEILRSDKFDVVLKTHPRETRAQYEQWISQLPPQLRKITYVPQEVNITPLILDCDLEISCEKCTTALESWMARKPTIELNFERHPLFYDAALSALNPNCSSPDQIVGLIEQELQEGAQATYAEGRRKHLAKWCHSPDGHASAAVARAIAEALNKRTKPKQIGLNFHDYRRGLKLKAYRSLGQPYTFFPLHQLGRRVLGRKGYSKKMTMNKKAITPGDVKQAMQTLEDID